MENLDWTGDGKEVCLVMAVAGDWEMCVRRVVCWGWKGGVWDSEWIPYFLAFLDLLALPWRRRFGLSYDCLDPALSLASAIQQQRPSTAAFPASHLRGCRRDRHMLRDRRAGSPSCRSVHLAGSHRHLSAFSLPLFGPLRRAPAPHRRLGR